MIVSKLCKGLHIGKTPAKVVCYGAVERGSRGEQTRRVPAFTSAGDVPRNGPNVFRRASFLQLRRLMPFTRIGILLSLADLLYAVSGRDRACTCPHFVLCDTVGWSVMRTAP